MTYPKKGFGRLPASVCFVSVDACSRLRVKLYYTDISEVSTIGEPKPSRSGIKEKSCIYGVIIFVAIG